MNKGFLAVYEFLREKTRVEVSKNFLLAKSLSAKKARKGRKAMILKRAQILIKTHFIMCAFEKHSIERAKEKLREKLTFQYVSKLPQYRNITKAQYERLIESIETLSLLLLETLINPNRTDHG